jgi:hypothetical protein
MTGEWTPGRWYRLRTADGTLWMETSDPDEAFEESESTGYPVLRQWTRTDTEWRVASETPQKGMG